MDNFSTTAETDNGHDAFSNKIDRNLKTGSPFGIKLFIPGVQS